MRLLAGSGPLLLATLAACGPSSPPPPHVPGPGCHVDGANVVLEYTILGYGYSDVESSPWVSLRLGADGSFCARRSEPQADQWEHSWGRCRSDPDVHVQALLASGVFEIDEEALSEEKTAEDLRLGSDAPYPVHGASVRLRALDERGPRELDLYGGWWSVAHTYETTQFASVTRAQVAVEALIEDCGGDATWARTLSPQDGD